MSQVAACVCASTVSCRQPISEGSPLGARASLTGAAADLPRRVRAFPRHDTQPYERFSPQPFVVAQRMEVLYRWLAAGAGGVRDEPAPVVVAPWTALAPRVPSRQWVLMN